MDLHLLYSSSVKRTVAIEFVHTHHLEIVDLLTDLLGKQRRQAVAGCNISPAVILATGPGVVELDARVPVDVPPADWLRSDWGALRVCAVVPATFRQEVIFTLDLHMLARARSWACRLIRGVGSTGMRRVTAVQCMRRRRVGVGF